MTVYHHPKGFAEHPVDPNRSTSRVFCNTCLQIAPDPERTDAEIWTDLYGPTIEEIETIARLMLISKSKVTRVIELAHNLRKARA